MNTVKAYFDTWSEVYDTEMQTVTTEDAEFYVEQARRADGPVLEIGCGTGRIYLELLEAGVDAYGIDVSAEMLDRLREKARDRGLSPAVEQADMADFAFDREFALVLLPADAFCYNLTIESQLATLANVRSALADDGAMVAGYFTPGFESICTVYGTEMTTEIEYDGEACVLESQLDFADEVGRIVGVQKTLSAPDGETITESECRFKLLPKREMELLLQRAGFVDYEVYGGYDRQELTDESTDMVWVARTR